MVDTIAERCREHKAGYRKSSPTADYQDTTILQPFAPLNDYVERCLSLRCLTICTAIVPISCWVSFSNW